MYRSTKTYGHDLGLSACFRQHKATHSHCSLLHGYALAFTFTFEAGDLDARNWVVDFGGLDELKAQLKRYFDHKLVVAEDDPQLDNICSLSGLGIADILVLPAVGCEAFAAFAAQLAHQQLVAMHMNDRVRVVSCEVREHGANSASFLPPVGLYDAPPPLRKFFGQQQETSSHEA
jgi:6-pyruvoyltetrahydropterin/6-carboxytetrahydropterin synthase